MGRLAIIAMFIAVGTTQLNMLSCCCGQQPTLQAATPTSATANPSQPDSPDTMQRMNQLLRLLRRNQEVDQIPEVSEEEDRLQNKVQSIGKKMDLLKEVLARKKLAEMSRDQPSDASTGVSNEPPPLPGGNRGDADLNNRPPVEPQPTANFPSGSALLENPVNSLQLADSLYMTSSYPAAVKSYQTLLEDAETQDEKMWLKLMIGICRRHQQSLDNAEQLFREVSQQRDSSSLSATHARWSLEQISRRRVAEKELETLQNQLKTLTEQASK